MRIVRILAIIGLVFLAAGCSTISVNQDYDTEADFTVYKTFAWLQEPVTAVGDANAAKLEPELRPVYAEDARSIVAEIDGWLPRAHAETIRQQARAIDNGVWIAAAHLPMSEISQRSYVLDPYGFVQAASRYWTDSVCIAEVDLDAGPTWFARSDKPGRAGQPGYLAGYYPRTVPERRDDLRSVLLAGRPRRHLLAAHADRAGGDGPRKATEVGPGVAQHGLNRHAECADRFGAAAGDFLQMLKQGGTRVPGHVFRLRRDVVTGNGGNRDRDGLPETEAPHQGAEFVFDLTEAGFRPVDKVHLVDGENDALQADEIENGGVAAGLGLDAVARVDQDEGAAERGAARQVVLQKPLPALLHLHRRVGGGVLHRRRALRA